MILSWKVDLKFISTGETFVHCSLGLNVLFSYSRQYNFLQSWLLMCCRHLVFRCLYFIPQFSRSDLPKRNSQTGDIIISRFYKWDYNFLLLIFAVSSLSLVLSTSFQHIHSLIHSISHILLYSISLSVTVCHESHTSLPKANKHNGTTIII